MAVNRNVYLVRHGRPKRSGTLLGHSRAGLTKDGVEQVELLAKQLAPAGVQRMFSSDLPRAAETALILSRRLRVRVEFDAALREISYGVWDGLPWTTIEARDPDAARRKLADWPAVTPAGGEVFAEFQGRVRAARGRILACPERLIVVVAHLGVNAILSGRPDFEQAYATAYRMTLT